MIPRCQYRRDDKQCWRPEGHDGEHKLIDPNADTVVIRISPLKTAFRRLWRAVWHLRK